MPLTASIQGSFFGALSRPIGAIFGNKWTAIGKPSQSSYFALNWSAAQEQFVLADSNGRLFTSPNGQTWTSRVLPGVARDSRAVVYSPGLTLWALVSFNNAGLDAVTSPDGITWTQRVTPAGLHQYTSIEWSPALGLFVACGAGVIPQLISSPDGITWTARTGIEPVPLMTPLDITWSPALGLFVTVHANGTGGFPQGIRVGTSPDGITWTPRVTPLEGGTSPSWRGVVWSPALGLFAAVGIRAVDDINIIMTSPDGITWTMRQSPFATSMESITWSPELGIFVAVSVADDVPNRQRRVIWSSDGITWVAAVTPFLALGQFFRRVKWGGPPANIFLAIGSGTGGGARHMFSKNGK
jgi:hypothetical protein